MDKPSEIAKMSMEFSKNLAPKAPDLLDRFTGLYSCVEMFTFLWSLEEAHKYLAPKLIHSRKSDTEAERYRIEGNRFFQMKDFDMALASYNRSIMAATHPPQQPRNCHKTNTVMEENLDSVCLDLQQCDISESSQYKTLALAFANRSALLLEQKEYKKSLADIDMALKFGYPKESHGKLALRKASCLLGLKQTLLAKEVLKTSLENLDSTADITHHETTKKRMLDLLERCHSEVESDSTGPLERDDFSYKPLELPRLDEVNPSIPALSSSIKMTFDSVKHRMLTAVKDVNPGEVLAVEESFAWSLDTKCLTTYCSECLDMCSTPLPCPHCSVVIFCSYTCRKKGLEGDHGRECSYILPTLKALGDGDEDYPLQLYRTITRLPFSKLRKIIPQLQKESIDVRRENHGFYENGIYDSKDYRTIYHLVNNKDFIDPDDVLQMCINAFIVMKVLEQSEFFTLKGEVITPSHKDKMLIGSTLFHHTMSLYQNAHHLSRIMPYTGKTVIGVAVFSALSLVCHSCNPSAMLINYGKYGILKSLRTIPAGSEVTVAYTNFLAKPIEFRKAKLKNMWHFTCSCEACVNDWPVMSNLTNDILLKCTKCHQLFSVQRDCPSCLSKRQKSKNDKIKLALEQHLMEIPSILEKDIIYSAKRAERMIDFIGFMDKHAHTLCRLYYEAICKLKMEYALEFNR